MYKYILLVTLVALAVAAPAPNEYPPISGLKTPASTAKLIPFAAPIPSPIIAPISHISYSAPVLRQVSPYGYPYQAPLVAAAPAGYSIEQHGYNIVY